MLKNKHNTAKRKHYGEYLLINIFVFAGIGLLSYVVFNVSIFNQFTAAFKDFTLTDLYFTRIINQNKIYKGPLVLVNVENKGRAEIAYLIQKIEECKPRVVGVDVIFPDKKDSSSDALLKTTLGAYDNLVLPYVAALGNGTKEIRNDPYFGTKSNSFVNVEGEGRQFSTIRYYYPSYHDQIAFTTAIMQKFDTSKTNYLLKRSNAKTEIRYYGNLQNFFYQTFDEVMNPGFDTTLLKDKIILLGYTGSPASVNNDIDEDKFFTPLNPRLSGRSFPDMYGPVINANILRMALDKDYIISFPRWLNIAVAFLLTLFLLPLFISWYIYKAVWFHLFTMMLQLLISILFVFFTIWLYANENIKIESSAVLIAILLIGDFLLFYDHFVKFLRHKLKMNFHSIFFNASH
ncbi:MAG: CHASE2 domain-containing protein [Chitinophagaceae bacterium]|nr:CHASE2 domain-containing protein [Chitinophagaceae bacterium]